MLNYYYLFQANPSDGKSPVKFPSNSLDSTAQTIPVIHSGSCQTPESVLVSNTYPNSTSSNRIPLPFPQYQDCSLQGSSSGIPFLPTPSSALSMQYSTEYQQPGTYFPQSSFGSQEYAPIYRQQSHHGQQNYYPYGQEGWLNQDQGQSQPAKRPPSPERIVPTLASCFSSQTFSFTTVQPSSLGRKPVSYPGDNFCIIIKIALIRADD